MDIKTTVLALALTLMAPLSYAGNSSSGKTFSNFGNDLTSPIFPANGTLKVYKNKNDAKPIPTRFVQMTGFR
ncbi:hypothetical protein ASE26_27840 [Duganella sp. Root198D2]|nr:hypothetical protein ASE26_27840 [Duganella sp. Root198D2]